ncbi:Gtr1/RagA G protein conserved region-domain-containing protein, partial [Schizophyllum fasciatum]
MPVPYSAATSSARRAGPPSATNATSPSATTPASPSPSSSAAAIANTVASPASAPAAVSAPRTKILLVGLRRSGKSSIREVLFADMPPKETFYLEPTMRTRKTVYDTLIPLELWDCPGTTTAENLGAPLSQFNALIFVIDMRDLYTQPISRLVEWITAATRDAPNLNLEVFVHKAEKLPEDDKIENFRQIQERVADRLL